MNAISCACRDGASVVVVSVVNINARPTHTPLKSVWDPTVRFRTTSGLDLAVDPIQMKNVTFDHVKGVEEAKNELQDVVEFLKNPEKFTVLGGKLPKGGTPPPRGSSFSLLLLVNIPISFQESSWSVLRERGRPCWRGPWPARPTCPSTTPPGQSSTRCSWALARAASGTSSVSRRDVGKHARVRQDAADISSFHRCRRGEGQRALRHLHRRAGQRRREEDRVSDAPVLQTDHQPAAGGDGRVSFPTSLDTCSFTCPVSNEDTGVFTGSNQMRASSWSGPQTSPKLWTSKFRF